MSSSSYHDKIQKKLFMAEIQQMLMKVYVMTRSSVHFSREHDMFNNYLDNCLRVVETKLLEREE